jgi:transcriptional regulator with XRE-family HTH domain
VKKKEGAKEAAADVDLPVLIALGKQVRKLRMAAGLSQHQFAEAAGTSHTYIVSIEAGVPNVSVAMLDKMAKVLGISIAAFFPDAEDGTEHIDPVLSRMASELHRVANAMDSRRDTIATILDELESRLLLVASFSAF